jgi:hypothetical protein
MNIQQDLYDLRLIQMRALTHEDHLEHYRVAYSSNDIEIKNEFGSGWSFFADEHTDNPAYQTLLWIKRFEDDLNKQDWDMSNPKHLQIAMRAYKAAMTDVDNP